MPTITFSFSNQLNKVFATPSNGQKFYVGSEVVYQGNHGLTNLQAGDAAVYDPAVYKNKFGFWADFIYPTAQCESQGLFHCLNTYDRAAFTFTFMQFAAHVPNGDFVKFFRSLLQLPTAKNYFPFLELRNGRIWYVNGDTENQLEDNNSTQALMDYLNPDKKIVDHQEKICSARLVYWCQQEAAHRELQISTAVDIYKRNMITHNTRYNLDGWPDYICQAICDIHHQGRAKVSLIMDILSNSNRQTIYQNLLNVGGSVYAERIKTLKAAHKKLMDEGRLGKRVYDSNLKDFRLIAQVAKRSTKKKGTRR